MVASVWASVLRARATYVAVALLSGGLAFVLLETLDNEFDWGLPMLKTGAFWINRLTPPVYMLCLSAGSIVVAFIRRYSSPVPLHEVVILRLYIFPSRNHSSNRLMGPRDSSR